MSLEVGSARRSRSLGPRAIFTSDRASTTLGSSRMLTRENKVVETTDVTWEATLRAGAPSPPLPEMPEQGVTMELGEAPEPGGTGDLTSSSATPLPVLGRGIPHQLRAGVSDDASWQRFVSRRCAAERLINDQRRIVRQRLGIHLGMGASSSDGRTPTPTAARVAARQLGVHM